MLTALFAYLIYRNVSDRDLATRPDDSEQFMILIAKGIWFSVTWPYHLIGISRYLEKPSQRVIWNIIFSVIAITVGLTGIWNYIALGIVLALIKGVGYLAYVYKIHLQNEQDDEEIEIYEK